MLDYYERKPKEKLKDKLKRLGEKWERTTDLIVYLGMIGMAFYIASTLKNLYNIGIEAFIYLSATVLMLSGWILIIYIAWQLYNIGSKLTDIKDKLKKQ